jgi:hypothetical protein
VTTTRIWELGVGGALAVGYPLLERYLHRHHHMMLIVTVVGILVMIGSAFLVTGAEFPGWIAAVPIAGAVLVLGAGSAHSPLNLLWKWRPIQLLGGLSYSVYLWHWPLVILVPWIIGREMTWPIKLIVIVVTVGLSWLSKTFVEDRFRGTRPLGVPLRRTFIFLVLGMAITLSCGLAGNAITHAVGKPHQRPVIPESATCVGAAVLLDPACVGQDTHGSELYTTPLQAQNDRSTAYSQPKWCWARLTEPPYYPVCHLGSQDPNAPHVALFGNSIAAPYLDPILGIAEDNQWSIDTYLAATCYPSVLPLVIAEASREGCRGFTQFAIDDMAERGINLVVMSSATGAGVLIDSAGTKGSDERKLEMFSELLNEIQAAGIHILVIKAVPIQPKPVPDCVAENLNKVQACDAPRKVVSDLLYEAAAMSENPAISALDLTDTLCDDTTCPSVVGGVIAYFDTHHLTRTFALSMRPYIEPSLTEALMASLE